MKISLNIEAYNVEDFRAAIAALTGGEAGKYRVETWVHEGPASKVEPAPAATEPKARKSSKNSEVAAKVENPPQADTAASATETPSEPETKSTPDTSAVEKRGSATDASPSDGSSVTADEIRVALAEVKNAHNPKLMLGVLKYFNVNAVKSLSPDDYERALACAKFAQANGRIPASDEELA